MSAAGQPITRFLTRIYLQQSEGRQHWLNLRNWSDSKRKSWKVLLFFVKLPRSFPNPVIHHPPKQIQWCWNRCPNGKHQVSLSFTKRNNFNSKTANKKHCQWAKSWQELWASYFPICSPPPRLNNLVSLCETWSYLVGGQSSPLLLGCVSSSPYGCIRK